jgi:uncharacterized protein (TIGR02996 family)
MFSVVVRRQDGATAILRFEKTEIMFGSDPASDVLLDGAAPRHARMNVLDGRFVLVDLGAGTSVNQIPITTRVVVREHDVVEIGKCRLAIVPTERPPPPPVDETEQRFLAQIQARPMSDDDRLVYCDWLEERGFDDRAEFLRLQIKLRTMSVKDPAFQPASKRLHVLGMDLDVDWRTIVARPAIDNCNFRFELRCPKQWDALAPTSNPKVRHCDSCARDVIYCGTILEARQVARTGGCVAIDINVDRRPDDLEEPQMAVLGRPAPR